MWAHVINAVIGLWLMAAPSVLGYANSTPATSDRFVGPVIATFAIVAWWETTRMVGRWNVALGLWLVAAPWILSYGPTAAVVNSMACGALVAGFSLVKGHFQPENYGGSWSALVQEHPPHERALQRGERRAER